MCGRCLCGPYGAVRVFANSQTRAVFGTVSKVWFCGVRCHKPLSLLLLKLKCRVQAWLRETSFKRRPDEYAFHSHWLSLGQAFSVGLSPEEHRLHSALGSGLYKMWCRRCICPVHPAAAGGERPLAHMGFEGPLRRVSARWWLLRGGAAPRPRGFW